MDRLPASSEHVLSLLAWNTCNAKCVHCGNDSGPDSYSAIPHKRSLELIREAGSLFQKRWCLTLSGGEIFLHYTKLLEYARAAQAAKGYTTLITNCFWATSLDKARRLLVPLVEADLKVLGISADHFHAQFVPLANVKHALMAARELALPVRLRSVASRSGRLSDTLRVIEEVNPWYSQFMEMPVVPHGRATSLPDSELFFADGIPSGKCPAPSMTINSECKAMVCCNGGGSFASLQIGDVRQNSLYELELLFASDPVVNYLRNNGPCGCLPLLGDTERQTFLGSSYVNECHLCICLFSDAARGERIRRAIEARFQDAMSSVTERMCSNNRMESAR